MSGPLRVAVIIGSTRPGRLGPVVAGWFADQAVPRRDVAIDLIDLADVDVAVGPRLAAADAFVVVTPEYNHSFPAPLKQVIDSFSVEWQAKPAAFVCYGGISGGLRAVQMAKQIVTTLKMMPIPEGVPMPMVFPNLDEAGNLKPLDIYKTSATTMLDELHRWTEALKSLRAQRKAPLKAAA
jgi:NAD(P)H-dependent FMN reductase